MHCDVQSQSRLSISSNSTAFHRPHLNFNLKNTPTRVSFIGSAPLGLKPRRFSVTTAAVKSGFIKPSEMSFYELLGIPETGTLVEIKQAYKQLARKYHPDVSPPDRLEEYTQRFIRVQEAYETLSDPLRRTVYDRSMSGGLRLAFSARKTYHYDQVTEDKSEWKNRWQSQLTGLKSRSKCKSSRQEMSWGERMRRQRDADDDEKEEE